MLSLTYPRLAQVAIALVAVASWLSLSWLALIFVSPSRSTFFIGLAICGAAWLLAGFTIFPLRCPSCGKRIGVVFNNINPGGNWAQFKEQFFPVKSLLRKQINCPHCGMVSSLRNNDNA